LGDKLESVLKFGTCHVISRMRNGDLALCLLEQGMRQNILETFRDRDLVSTDHQ